MLRWARESAGYSSLPAAAEKANVAVEALEAWENGESTPTIVQARTLARVYKRPLAAFYLPEPPKGFDVLRELRRLPGIRPDADSPSLRFAVREAFARRETALSLTEDVNALKPSPKQKASIVEDVEELAIRIRLTLGVPDDFHTGWNDNNAAFIAWRRVVEGSGILVFQSSELRIQESRGFCLPDDPLPVIVLSSKDCQAAKTFTLVHELVHVWLTRGGHVVSASERMKEAERQKTEVFANDVAAAVLIPSETLLLQPEVGRNKPGSWNMNDLRRLANRFGVSQETMLRRLVTKRRATLAEYQEKRAIWLQMPPKVQTSGPVPPHKLSLSRLGRSYVNLLLDAYYESKISLRTLSNEVNLKVQHLAMLEKAVGR